MVQRLCGEAKRTEPVQVISAFEVPRIAYDPIRKIFYAQPGRPPLHGTAEARLLLRDCASSSVLVAHASRLTQPVAIPACMHGEPAHWQLWMMQALRMQHKQALEDHSMWM